MSLCVYHTFFFCKLYGDFIKLHSLRVCLCLCMLVKPTVNTTKSFLKVAHCNFSTFMMYLHIDLPRAPNHYEKVATLTQLFLLL